MSVMNLQKLIVFLVVYLYYQFIFLNFEVIIFIIVITGSMIKKAQTD